MNHNVLFAIFKRNFFSYFLNPTGYVFICVFVLLSSLAAFWPNEFFTANLANLDQLNRYFPLIMLIFIPAITMSIWAEERRQGTDELLLTIPATDFDVVMGKYLASVAIYASALTFSLVCNFAILNSLGNPDWGLFFSTYLGYLMVGLAMLSIGMVASFLTSNITVGFVLGAILCAIPIGLNYVEVILPPQWAIKVSNFGIAKQLLDFTLGVCSLSSLAYFGSIVVIMLYLSIILIGRRHWVGGRDGKSLGPHYLARIISLTAGAVGIVLLTTIFTARADLTAESLNSLTPATRKVVSELDSKRPIHIEAFISPAPPKEFVPLREDLIRQLREIAAKGGGNVTLRINDTLPFTEEADRAEKVYGIKGQEINSDVRGRSVGDTVFLGVAISAGLDKIVIPFVYTSTPIEYELVRSIATLNGNARKRLGLFVGDKTSFQEFDNAGQPRDPEIILELRKQYEVIALDAAKPVPDNIDVLMAVQPTVMQPTQLEHLVTAIRRGVPTLLFQDPLPISFDQLRQKEMQDNGGFPHVQDADTKGLWDLLGVESGSQQIVVQDYNPLQWMGDLPPSFVFASNGALGKNAAKASLFNEKDPISSKTESLVFIMGGWVAKKESHLSFEPLVHTSKASGYIERNQALIQAGGGMLVPNPEPERKNTQTEYVMVARIKGNPTAEPPKAGDVKRLADETPTTDGGTARSNAPARNEVLLAQAPTPGPAATAPVPSATASATKPAATGTAPAAVAAPTPFASPTASASATGPAMIVNPYVVSPAKPTGTAAPTASASPSATASGTAAAAAPAATKPMDVVIITDLDLIGSAFFRFRQQRRLHPEEMPAGGERSLNFDNVTMVLNALDSLAGDERFIDVRKHRPIYRTLTTLDEINTQATDERNKEKQKKQEELNQEVETEKLRLAEELKNLRANTTLKMMDKERQIAIFLKDQDRRLEAKNEQISLALKNKVRELERTQNEEIRRRQDVYKSLAVFVPPIFPLLIGIAVFFSRRAGEQEGVDRNRLR